MTAALSVFAVLFPPAAAHAVLPAPAPAAAFQRHVPGDTITLPVRDALAALPLQDESRTGYTRDKFWHWIEADKNGVRSRDHLVGPVGHG
ncbi:hypothetical protein [Streptomyces sp. R35]|uniref:Uncharacterized protein n=1 Tax=Streptomyces sp. R35 TaxID=3238630 RepID=A0AB39SMM1_9ACTN